MAAVYHPLVLLLVVPVLLWLLTPPPQATADDAPPRLWEGALAVALGVGVTAAMTTQLFPWHAVGGPYTSNDFTNYCASIAALNSGAGLDGLQQAGWHMTRSLTTGALPALLARRLGALDGLTVGAWAGCAATVAVLYGWGRALHSREAGVTAAVLAASLPSLVIMSRSVNFYPEMLAGLVRAC